MRTTTRILTVMDLNTFKALTELGFTPTGPTGVQRYRSMKARKRANEPITQEVTLPEGWTLRADEHSRFLRHFYDAQGRLRGQHLWKRRGDIENGAFRLYPRFSINDGQRTIDETTGISRITFSVEDRLAPQETLFASRPQREIDALTHPEQRKELDDAGRRECAAWLKKRFPRWKNPAKHWDTTTETTDKATATQGDRP